MDGRVRSERERGRESEKRKTVILVNAATFLKIKKKKKLSERKTRICSNGVRIDTKTLNKEQSKGNRNSARLSSHLCSAPIQRLPGQGWPLFRVDTVLL